MLFAALALTGAISSCSCTNGQAEGNAGENAETAADTAYADSTPLRLAVAGVTHGHLGEVRRRIGRGDFEIVGVYEKDDRYREKNELTGHVAPELFFSNLGKMLDRTRPEVVVAYGSIYDHLAVVEACAPRHIDVMVEKPLAVSAKHAEKMAALAEKYGIKVLTNYETTWYASNTHAMNLVDSGEIGKVVRINVYDGHQGPQEIGCEQRFLEWLTDPKLNGGGAVVDFGCYGANLATWLLKGQKPHSVSAVLKQNKPEVYPNVDDDATIVLDYPGAVVQIMASWCWPMSRKDMYIYGLDGYIYQKDGKNMETYTGNGLRQFEAPALQAPYNDSFLYLKAAVRDEITIAPHDQEALENNVMVVKILEAARKSAKTGKAVEMD
ncbi:MAG: Gfo/Idh/MocA family oxidoreductase [Bacteroidales bacterium]|nr:Gfo/Idh/MocA family oxidoreductase [Bacteroidales bacterium]